ncbi:winged helix-turn-helix transcriptional regulator, MarR family [Syntrophotalea carbinolica DSM 2380]|uniref:Winged helix-turn-helix transcriptional regulator, MarR family n=1 Tax=Syntrophotalea carbinolica (strain DSM 2380 / NBRC 103641 / GraBd1) TaxID=338963 RepID=Q3A151_SYNC1|nr:MarR family transcriptional regulator [Syntrophotalea carbinolica]ABA89906.1 winged helix-turn-helix transcriptional regulator, MarR family [Syntrophotalea carbinolica DSM 2380]
MERIRQLQQLAHKLARVEDLPIEVDKELAISTREAHTIQAIGEQAALCVKDIATRFGVTKSAASQMVSKLARKGFIDKQLSAHSNKELRISLTPLGWQAFRAHEQAHAKDLSRIVERMQSFSAGDIATLEELLHIFDDVADERLTEE